MQRARNGRDRQPGARRKANRAPRSVPTTGTSRPGELASRSARFQQWEALLGNRNKRQRLGQFLVQGVRPINEALGHGWHVQTLLHAGDTTSRWAKGLLGAGVADEQVQLTPGLLRALSQKDDDAVELIAVVRIPPDDLGRIDIGSMGIVVVLDRPVSPGNIGSLLRSCDALGVSGVIITGHAADPYDPKAVRASRGSLFAVPAVRVPSPLDALEWLRAHPGLMVVGTSENADTTLWAHHFHGPTALVVGNETTGMSNFWSASCDHTVGIPMVGSASSFNATVAASITLYEILRQRHTAT